MLLIVQPRNGSEIQLLKATAEELGWEVIEAPQSWRLKPELVSSGKIGVPYGTQFFCEIIAQQMNWKLKFNPLDWLSKIARQYLGRKVDFMPLQQAMNLSEVKFIKPADDKVFPAKIYHSKIDSLHPTIPLTTPALVSDIVNFVSEYRCFVTSNEVITCCCYLMNEKINQPENWEKGSKKVQAYLQNLLDQKVITTEPAVIDLGYLDNGELVIIESNPAWASGLYGCNSIGVLKVLEKSVQC